MSAVVEKFRNAPFPYFGGKRSVTTEVWARLGSPAQYIEPFCGSAAMLLASPSIASLEVIGDQNFYVANFWRCIKFQPDQTYRWQDYPVSHVNLNARHRWLTEPQRTAELVANLADAEWPGDPQIAGWWVWGQSAWIGSGWCEKSQIPHVTSAGQGVNSQIPRTSAAGQGVNSKIPHVTNAGRGVQSQIPHVGNAGRGVRDWFQSLANRLERVRVIHGNWTRCLNHHYGGKETAIFFDPPYRNYETLYHKDASQKLIADDVADWCREHEDIRIALCGHVGDYDLDRWNVFRWSRGRLTYGGSETTAEEAIWFSPSCLIPQPGLFA